VISKGWVRLMGREEALKLLKEHLHDDRLVKHSLAVEAIMAGLAERFGEDRELWSLTGLLHDLDYEETSSNFQLHGVRSAELLEGKLPQEALEAIRAHNELTGYRSESRLALALQAADQVSGLITATALVMPGKKLREVKVSSLKKKFKQKDFARKIDRGKILQVEKLGLTLEDFFALSLESLQAIDSQLGL